MPACAGITRDHDDEVLTTVMTLAAGRLTEFELADWLRSRLAT